MFKFGVVLFKLFEKSHRICKIIKILEVDFKEIDLFFNFLEKQLIIPVIIKPIMNQYKKLLIQLSYSINIGKQNVNLFWGKDFVIEEVDLEITDDNTEIMNVFFLSEYKLLDDFFSFIKIFP